ncbi:MAG: hypothetical protein RR394_03450, partial [Oscillospiraceae bacterium]
CKEPDFNQGIVGFFNKFRTAAIVNSFASKPERNSSGVGYGVVGEHPLTRPIYSIGNFHTNVMYRNAKFLSLQQNIYFHVGGAFAPPFFLVLLHLRFLI